MESNTRQALAIIGIGCRFPGGASGAGALWQRLIGGVDAISEVPRERWEVDRFFHPEASAPGKTYARHGGFLDQSPFDFDAAFFGLSNREAAVLDPQQRLLLEVAWEAFEDAGLDATALRRRPVGVFVGGFSLDNLIDRFGILSRDEISSSTATSSTMAMLANRLSHAFDLTGPSLTIDTACSSSLVATHLACASLAAGESEIAIAGGVNVLLAPEPFMAMAKGGFLSRTGRCRAFDADADGYVRAEGAGIVVLKPLDRALADGDRVYAQILATGVNQDGHTPGISMPNPEAQEALIRRVVAEAGIAPSEVAYAEAHGPGTQAGDPIEAGSLGRVYGAGRPQDRPLPVGSIKTNIGHTEAAAGVAGLIKAALVLAHREVPPNLHFRTPNPRIDFRALGLAIPTHAVPLPSEGQLCAAVNSFGYGGTNAHAVLASAPSCRAEPEGETGEALRLFPLSARDGTALAAWAGALAEEAGRMPLAAVGHTLVRRRMHHPVRAAVWARTPEELADGLRRVAADVVEGDHAPEVPRRLLFTYTGMGAQYRGMGRRLFAGSRVFRDAIERCDRIARDCSGQSVLGVFDGDPDAADAGAAIRAPIEAQLPNLALQVGLTELWRSLGVVPDGVVGHSVGEFAAAWASGVLTLEEAVRLTCVRGEIFQRIAGRGSMLAVGLGRAAVEARLPGDGELTVSAILAPDAAVVGGPGEALDRLSVELARDGVFHRRLEVDVAYHHAQVEAIEAALRAGFGEVAFAPPRLPLYSTLEGRRIDGDRHDLDYWLRNGRRPADFERAMTAAIGDGFDAVLEIGPNRVMGAAVRSCAAAAGRAVWTGASMIRGEPETERVRALLAEMYSAGVPIDWDAHHPTSRFVPLPAYPWQRTRIWAEAAETRAARELSAERPLLHQRVQGAAPAWESDLGAAALDYLADHVVGGSALFPAAGHVAVLLAASEAIGRGNSLDGLRIVRALPLSEATRIRVEVDPESGVATVSARNGHDEAWQRCASARLGSSRGRRRREPAGADGPRLGATEVYALLRAGGLAYGSRFQPIREVARGDAALVAELALPAGVPAAGPLHPVLLDGAFQALAALGASATGPFVPVSIEEVRLHGSVETAARVVARVVESTANGVIADLTLVAPDGGVLAEIDGLRCQRLPVASRQGAGHVEEVWESLPVPAPGEFARRWLLIDGAPPRAGIVADELRACGQGAVPAPFDELERLLDAERPDGVAWFAGPQDPDAAGLAAVARLLDVVQVLTRRPMPRPRLAIVTGGATGETARPDDAAVWGLGRVVASEYPDLDVALIDCADDDRTPLWLARELAADTPEREVRLGTDGRRGCRVVAWSAPERASEMVDVAAVPVALRQMRPGSPDSLAWCEILARAPGPDEIEVRSTAASLNFKDVLKSMNMLSSAYLERTFFGDSLGMETAGVVTRVGADLTGFAVGDDVVCLYPNFASRQTLPARFAARRPARLAAKEAPVFINYMTAFYGMLEVGRLREGERVLIHLASGGVGQAAVALARMVGAEIFATAGDEDKRDFLRRQGIAQVFDSRSLDFADEILAATDGTGVDVVLNSLAGEALRRSWDVLAPYGRFIEIGKRDIENDSALGLRRFDANRTFAAVDVDRLMRERPKVFRRIFDDVAALFAEGRIGPIPVTAFPAAEVADAFRLMARAKHVGKVVVEFSGDPVPAVRLPKPRFRADRTYLVTGAFGGFGEALARWMAAEGARRLVLVGRSGPRSGGLVEDLAAAGVEARVARLDISDGAAVRDLLAGIRAGNAPLGGVFHAAMVLDDGLIAGYDAARLRTVMAPKALGALHLHRESEGDPVEHFVLFSSVAQLIGNPGQGAYCAANAYLDGLARHRRARGLPGLSVAWGVLGDAGVAARSGLVGQLETAGLRAFTTAEALVALGPLIDAAPANVTCADVDWERWAAGAVLARTPRFGAMVRTAGGGDRLSELRRALAELPAAERIGFIETKVRAALGTVLRADPATIPPERSLDGLGVDSLMAVELALGLEQDIGIKLPTTLLMQGPSVTELASQLVKELLAVERLAETPVEALTEAETDAMLEALIAAGDLDLASLP